MDLEKLRQRLNEKAAARKGSSANFFKPSAEAKTIRVLPYKYASDPFVEIQFHYDIAGEQSVVCPKQHDGSPCPICDLADEFRRRGGDENWQIFKALAPKPRYYSPIIVRGEEDAGVKIWGYPPGIWNELVEYALDPDWGDFTDPVDGRDISVKMLNPGDPGNNGTFKRPSITLKPKATPIASTKAEIKSILESVPNFFESSDSGSAPFEIKSYEQLVALVKKYGSTQAEVSTSEVEDLNAKQTKSSTSQLEDDLDSLLS